MELNEIEKNIKDAVIQKGLSREHRLSMFDNVVKGLFSNGYKTAITKEYVYTLLSGCVVTHFKTEQRVCYLFKHSAVLNQEIGGFTVVLNPERFEFTPIHKLTYRVK